MPGTGRSRGRRAASPMAITPPAAPASDTASGRSIYLSGLLGRPLADRGGQPLGKLADVIVRLRGADYPLVTGLVGTVGGREVFVPVGAGQLVRRRGAAS